MRRVEYRSTARRDLKAIPKDEAATILRAINAFAAGGGGDVIRLHGRSDFRLRVGTWRVLFDLHPEIMTVRRVVRRSERTYR